MHSTHIRDIINSAVHSTVAYVQNTVRSENALDRHPESV